MEFDTDGRTFYIIAIHFVAIILGMLAALPFKTLFLDDSNGESSFVCVETTFTSKIVYHKETKVMYAVSTGGDNKGVFTVLVDENGNPMVWEEQQNEEKKFK